MTTKDALQALSRIQITQQEHVEISNLIKKLMMDIEILKIELSKYVDIKDKQV
jgi:hypothetical protein